MQNCQPGDYRLAVRTTSEMVAGGGIRTPDLWVMSPTSCRCSTPRRTDRRPAVGSVGLSMRRFVCRRVPAAPRGVPGAGGARGGLASRGVAPTVLSGAALGHDRVRDGTGWGQRALGHGRPRPPEHLGLGRRRRVALVGVASSSLVCRLDRRPGGRLPPGRAPAPGLPRRPRRAPRPRGRSRRGGVRPQAAWVHGACGCVSVGRGSVGSRAAPRRPAACCGGDRPRPSARLGSGRLPAVHPPPRQPGGLPGALPIQSVGGLILGRASHLDAVSGSPVRTRLPSGAPRGTTGPPAVRPSRSSRTRDGPPQSPNARGG